MRLLSPILILLAALLPRMEANESLEFFEKEIRPVLAEKCYSCHAADAKKLKGGLQLDHREHLLAGGETGPAITPGDVEASLLIESIRYGNEDLQMPPKEKLSSEIVAKFEQWIANGAPWPEEPVPQRGEKKEESFDLQKRFEQHWSWRPVTNPDFPKIENTNWPETGPDHFILAGIEEAGLRPAPPAEKNAWLRRVYFDLIGLPPTVAQLESFLADETPEAFSRVVDELLASPHFGEKWARHWMDLVRYAETYGHEFDYPIAGAHEYRDYLIRAFNADVPYDLFVKEHIAGDLIENPRRHPTEKFNESILGTGFWYFHEATHAPTDVLANEADIMDNQIDVFGKSFLGLTVSCARCHDHKFDAISTADYYAMTAYLHGSARQEMPLDVGRVRETTREKLEGLRREADQMLSDPGADATALPSDDGEVWEDFSGNTLPEGWTTTGYAFAPTGEKSGIRFEEDYPRSRPGTVDSGLFGKEQVGILRSPTFTIESNQIHILAKGQGAKVRLIIDNYQMARFNALLFRGTHDEKLDTKGEFQWKSLAGNINKYVGHKAYLEFIDPGEGTLILDEIRFSGSPPRIEEGEKDLSTTPLPEKAKELVAEGASLAASLPAPRYAVAMAEGTPEKAHVYVRGSPRSLGEVVPPRTLEALGGRTGDRLFLAEEITRPSNPLTSRVLVNRIWHHLFGTGLVPTVDDFGPMGRPASHPELLDWLASDLVANGWSIKSTIRQLVLSSTYRQSSSPHPDLSPETLAEADPSNTLLSRMPVKRLTGEAIRDFILAVSGRLDPKQYGPSIPTHRTPFMTGRGGKASGPVDGAGRRSVYGAIYRNFLSPFMLTFDVPSPFGPKGRRSVSNVPAQALVLMNDPFVAEQSQIWAKRLLAEAPNEEARLTRLFEMALSRKPTEQEKNRVQSFLASQTENSPLETWTSLVHVAINKKEFIFIP
ncbi:MAG: PSD1 and planctomycete cytochrome C domain-containing protein [Verrucomicrobiales bacterium]|nr:PSD1 and planctomycete cytochrome C domain-containing protein [Verrucomicrobiales bacterium]